MATEKKWAYISLYYYIVDVYKRKYVFNRNYCESNVWNYLCNKLEK